MPGESDVDGSLADAGSGGLDSRALSELLASRAEQSLASPVGRRHKELVEAIEAELAKHEPVAMAADPQCPSCQRLVAAYQDMLWHLVVETSVVRDTEQELRATRAAFESGLRSAYAAEIRAMESAQPRPRRLEEQSPEHLGKLLVALADASVQSAYQAGAENGKAERERLEARVAELERRVVELESESVPPARLAAMLGVERYGVPAPLVEQLVGGKVPLVVFLLQLLGPADEVVLEGSQGGAGVVVSRHRAPSDAPAAMGPSATKRPMDGAADRDRASRQAPGHERADRGERADENRGEPSSKEHEAWAGEGGVTIADAIRHLVGTGRGNGQSPAAQDPRGEEAWSDVQGPPQASGAPAGEKAGEGEQEGSEERSSAIGGHADLRSGAAATPESMRRQLALLMTQGGLFSMERLKRAEPGLGVPLGEGLLALQSAGMVEVVPTTSGDALVLPTDSFRSVVTDLADNVVPAYQAWTAMRSSLKSPEAKQLVAEALCPFLALDHDLVLATVDPKQRFVSLVLLIPESQRGDLGVLVVLTGDGPYQPPEIPSRCSKVWVVGSEERLASYPEIPAGPSVWHGPERGSADSSSWTLKRKGTRRPSSNSKPLTTR
jgi:hypothetical protein